ncbi:uncharacterized protein LOC141651658 [Silene latifolia]|uniref:uncharacterized protein LOC141651658 n=1 Tax=Silene latifolia TaxID=37657 RepID=UPI003D7886C6
MKATQDRQKSYADLHRRDIEFEVGDKYMSDPSHVVEVENIELDEALTYVKGPMEILDRKVRETRNGETIFLKLLLSNNNVEESTLESEEALGEPYPHLFDQVFGYEVVTFVF